MKSAEKYEEVVCEEFEEESELLHDSMLVESPANSPVAGKAKGE